MKKICALALCLLMLMPCLALAAQPTEALHGFTQVQRRWIDSENAYGTLYLHEPSGLSLFHLEDEAEALSFSIGFITPPQSDKGANHVLEHAVLCGSDKYPLPSLMQHLRSTSLAWTLNAVTNDRTTAYIIRTGNEADYYNLMDVYLNAVFHPLILREKNIFFQQGMRWEITADGIVPNGVVYNELRQNSLETGTSMLLEVVRALNAALFVDSTPVYSSGGELDALLDLTYAEVLDTYAAYYHPDNALIFISGQQDIGRTFALLDEYLKAMPASSRKASPVYKLRDQARLWILPEEREDESALTDVGFAFSGIPAGEPRSAYARDAMLMLAIDKLREDWPEVYMVSDSTSGYATFSIIVSGVPDREVNGLIEDVERYLLEDMEALLSAQAMEDALSTYEWMVEDGHGWALYSTLQGFAGGDPYAAVDKAADFAFLRETPEFLHTVWQQHIVYTPHRAIATAHQQPREDITARSFTEAEAEQLQAQTEAFHAWVDTPETAAQLKSLPLLRINDYTLKDLNHPYEAGSREGIRYWLQPSEEAEGLMALAVPYAQDRWLDLSLLSRALSYQEDLGIAYFFAYNDPDQPGHITPKLIIHPADMAGGIKGIAEMLASPQWLTAEKVADILALELSSVSQYLGNAYSRTLEALYSDISPTNRFSSQTLGLIGNGTEAYLAYLEALCAQPPEAIANMLRELAVSLADREGMLVYMRGDEAALDRVLAEITAAFPASKNERQLSTLPPTEGTHSALVITPQAESTVHYLQAGVFDGTAWQRDGHMDIMAQVLQNGYVLPELRNKRGAYGAQVLVENGYITLGASGVSSIDEAYQVLLGAGDYLRSLDIPQEYLDAVIVSAVSAFDTYHGDDAYYAMEADLSGQDVQWLAAHREQMLSTTVEDVKAYAGFIDEMIRQQRVFAYTNAQGALTSLDFAQTIDLTK